MRNARHNHGFTIVELLIALAITGILLAAVAVAFNASIINYTENQNIFKSINGARQALSRITTQVRTGLVDPNNIFDQTRCKVLCADGSTVTYRYESGEQKLYLNTSGVDHLLCDNVAAMTFKKDNGTPTGDVKSVQISMTVVSGDVRQTVSAAAVVRKVLN
jgi:prepilin-type N-terminal cleavage/methylation domain-containing protein